MKNETSNGHLLDVNNIEVVYNDIVQVLRGVSLSVAEGSIVCLLGTNGAGKTTLFNLITGQLKPDDGRVIERRDDDRGQQFVVATDPGKRRKAADAGHAQVEKQQIGLRILLDDALQRVQAVGFDDAGIRDAIADRVDQRFAE